MVKSSFKTKEVKMITLGDFLLQERQSRGLTLKDLADQTHIKQIYLDCLEQSDFSKLPADVYVKGFLKNLAMYFNVEDKDLIEQYERERLGEKRLKKNEEVKDRLPFVFTPKTAIFAVVVIAFLGLLFYLGVQVKSVITPPFLELKEPAEGSKVVGTSVIVSGTTEVGADLTINNQAVLVDAGGNFNENLIVSLGYNVLEVIAQNKFGRSSKIIRGIQAEPETSEVRQPEQQIKLEISIGPNSAWVYMEADGVVVQRGTMLSGSNKVVNANSEILLTTSNAGSTKVLFDGKDLGVLGREGEVLRQLEFNKNSQPK
jgi:transcriptional regulator with XRE-family HTH domain